MQRAEIESLVDITEPGMTFVSVGYLRTRINEVRCPAVCPPNLAWVSKRKHFIYPPRLAPVAGAAFRRTQTCRDSFRRGTRAQAPA